MYRGSDCSRRFDIRNSSHENTRFVNAQFGGAFNRVHNILDKLCTGKNLVSLLELNV